MKIVEKYIPENFNKSNAAMRNDPLSSVHFEDGMATVEVTNWDGIKMLFTNVMFDDIYWDSRQGFLVLPVDGDRDIIHVANAAFWRVYY